MGNKSSHNNDTTIAPNESTPSTTKPYPTSTELPPPPPPTSAVPETVPTTTVTTKTVTTTAATTPTPKANTPVPTVTTTPPTPTPPPPVTSTAPATPKPSTDLVTVQGSKKSTFYSVVKDATADANKTKKVGSAYSHWYKYSQFEQKKRTVPNSQWYRNPQETTTPVPTTDAFSPAASTLSMTTARIASELKESTTMSDIIVVPTYQMRSTAVYSPPHGDRIQPGRHELMDTNTINFKYYTPENRSNKTTGLHTKATMFKMDTRTRQVPLPTQSSSSDTTTTAKDPNDSSTLPTFVSRGLQTDFEVESTNLLAPMQFYEKQQSHILPVSALDRFNSSNQGFYHISSDNPPNQPVLPPIEKTPVWNYHHHPSMSDPSSFLPHQSQPMPPSILKNSSTAFSQDMSNPLSHQTHDRILEELRRHQFDNNDGTYRIKKVHVLEKNDPAYQPPTVRFNLPPSTRSPYSKASQSIWRSERLFSSRVFNRK